ncbi:hypothetical protein AKJ47_02585 [candidate division MSBL1 archaeon SCGC-AAA261G05]|uniref:Uncharacterized protein n=2 Tax=candidate division MSBL1 TaxID=215777 RepID=A0A133V9X5_9EURY|nr:hypothetical protein AKJ47_02585 [candidate division MSBL1 archaeon SCGC-AAA261G05]KXB05039.1 hypothetical protein AKJ48_00550 [candidate division MSBL1 archaeon SCGC-AAA261O19]
MLNPLGPPVEGVSYSVGVILFILVEGLAYSLVVAYFIHRFVKEGARFTLDLFNGLETGFIDILYHKSIPRAVTSTFRNLFEGFELPVVDKGFNEKLVDKILSAGELFGKIQTERINHYLIIFGLGILLSLALVLGGLL